MKKTGILLLAVALMSCTIPQTGWATSVSGPGLTFSPAAPDNSLIPKRGGATMPVAIQMPQDIAQGDSVIDKTGTYVITGKSTVYTVKVNPNLGTVNITLNNANIDVSSKRDVCAFSIGKGTTVNLTVAGDNVLKSGANCAGLQVHQDAQLTITAQSTGTVHATGGDGSAGIGGGRLRGSRIVGASTNECDSGQVTVNGGTIYATGGHGGAGIGGGSNNWANDINGRGGSGAVTVNDGTIYALGRSGGASIGGGSGYTQGGIGTVTVKGGTINSDASVYGIGGGVDNLGYGEPFNNDGMVIVDGGSVNGVFTDTPKNSAGQTLYRTVVSVDGVYAVPDVVCFIEDGAAFVCSTDAEGKLYLWLPAKTTEKKSVEEPAKLDVKLQKDDPAIVAGTISSPAQPSAPAVTGRPSDETTMEVHVHGKEYNGSGVVKRDGTGSWTVYLKDTSPIASIDPPALAISGIQFKVGNDDFTAISAPATGIPASSGPLPSLALPGSYQGGTVIVTTGAGTLPLSPGTLNQGSGSAIPQPSGGNAVSGGVPALAGSAQAQAPTKASGQELLLNLGILKGTSPTAFQADNNLPLTRETGVTVAIREFGQEASALSMNADEAEQILKDRFSDWDLISKWARKQVAFSVRNDIVQGRPGGLFAPLEDLQGNDLATIALKEMGYSGVQHSVAMKTLAQLGAVPETKAAEMANRPVLRGECFDIAADLLVLENANGIPVINLLAQGGATQRERALRSGLMRSPSVATVQFSRVLRLKKGTSLELPQKVFVTFTNQRTGEMPVDWDPFKTDSVGSVKLEGTIKGTAFRVAVPIEVYEEKPVQTSHSSSSSYTPPSPVSASIDSLIEKVEATGVHTLLMTMKQGKLLNSLDKAKIKFHESDGGEIPALLVSDAVISQDKLSATLTLNADLTESAKADGEDLDASVTRVRTYFSEGALSLTDGTVSQALAGISGLTATDKIAPTVQAVYAKGDSGTDHNIVVVKFNEDVFENAGSAAAGFTVTDITAGNAVLTPVTDYTTAAGGGNIEITVIKTGIRDHKFSVALTSGSNIGDNAGGHAAFNAGNNHPAPFAERTLLKADAVTVDGTLSVQDVDIMAYDNGALATETDDRILLSLPESLTATTLDAGDITVEFDSASADPSAFVAGITLIKDGSDFTVSAADGKLALTLTKAAQDKIDTEINSGQFRVTIVPGAHTITPGFDVATPSVITFGLTHADIIAAD